MKVSRTRMTAPLMLCMAAVLVFCGILVSCGSLTTQKTEVLDDKGAAFNIPAPDWVKAYITDGVHAVEALPQYSREHCFVVEFTDKNKDFAVNWVKNASGPAQVAQMVSATVLADAKSKIKGSRGDNVEASLENAAHAMSEASYTGLRSVSDWWQIVRNKSTKAEEARAFALWTVDKKSLDTQIAGNLQNIIDNNKELSQAARSIYMELIRDIRANGFNNR